MSPEHAVAEPAVIRLSAKGLAKFMASGDSARRTILHDFKYPDPEGKAQAAYYREARDRIRDHHRLAHGRGWLEAQATTLATDAHLVGGARGVRLRSNARAISAYAAHYSNRAFEVGEDRPMSLAIGGVSVSVVPDLVVTERGRRKIIKLEFAVEKPKPLVVTVMCQLLYEAALAAGLALPTSASLYLDVVRREEHHRARKGARVMRDVAAACATIEALWDGIER